MVRANGEYITLNLPDVEDLPFVQSNEKKLLPHCPGIYFLINDYSSRWGHSVGYVGQAEDIHDRCVGHEKLNGNIISISWLDLSSSSIGERLALEKLYMLAYKPPYNKEIMERY